MRPVNLDSDGRGNSRPARTALSWDVINLRMGYRFQFCTLNVGVDNLFDKIYASANSYEWDVVGGTGANPAIVYEPGRFVYGSFSFKW